MKKPIIICVDDEKFFLTSLKNEISRIFSSKIVIEIAESGEEALELIYDLKKNGYEIPVIISDFVMNGMYGDEFLKEAQKIHPSSKKILLTGQATLSGVRNSINDANLYRYVIKPWDSTDLQLTLSEAFRLFYKERLIDIQNKHIRETNTNLELKIQDIINDLQKKHNYELNKILNEYKHIFISSLKVFFDLAYKTKNPQLQKISRVFKYSIKIINQQKIRNNINIEIGVILSMLYLLQIDNTIHNKIQSQEVLNKEELKKVGLSRTKIYQYFKNIPFVNDVSTLIFNNYEFLDDLNSELDDSLNLSEKNILLTIKLSLFFDIFIEKGYTPSQAVNELTKLMIFDSKALKSLNAFIFTEEYDMDDIIRYDFLNKTSDNQENLEIKSIKKGISLNDLETGMILADNIEDINGNLLIPGGQEVFDDLMSVLLKFKNHQKIKEPIYVVV
jgi:CheY-like chemotaxis protein